MPTNVTASEAVSKDELIVAMLEKATPMLRRVTSDLGCLLGYDFDDLYQMAAVLLLENFEKIQWDYRGVSIRIKLRKDEKRRQRP